MALGWEVAKLELFWGAELMQLRVKAEASKTRVLYLEGEIGSLFVRFHVHLYSFMPSL